jgi:hypothetical protein
MSSMKRIRIFEWRNRRFRLLLFSSKTDMDWKDCHLLIKTARLKAIIFSDSSHFLS